MLPCAEDINPRDDDDPHATASRRHPLRETSECSGNVSNGYSLGVTAMKIAALKRFAAGVTLFALMGSATAFAQHSNKPNILFILADNLGYGDLGVYGGGA